MKAQYNLSDAAYIKLLNAGITVLDLVAALPKFRAEDKPVTPMKLCYFLDDYDSSDPIFQACLSSLEQEDMMEVIGYMELLEEEKDET